MEGLNEFLNIDTGYGYGAVGSHGDGHGDGHGNGYGDGYGDGSGFSSGKGFGSSDGDCDGNNNGDGYGDGSGGGSGYGYGAGYGFCSGYGSCTDIIMFNVEKIYLIDGVPTIIKKIKKQIAKGFILRDDLTLQPCYVAKINNCYAHGNTIREAVKQAKGKAFELLPEDDRIKKFWECHNLTDRYPAKDLYEWHHILTGSCEMGRSQFVREKGVDLEMDTFTVDEFVKMCKDRYGGDVIKKLIKEECDKWIVTHKK